MFQILFVDTGLPLSIPPFATPKEAAEFCNKYRAETGIRVRMQRIVTEDWREREAKRIADGVYKPLPEWWQDAAWWQGSVAQRDHYAHLSEDGQRIAFTESAEKGAADLQLVLSATKYLTRYFSDVMPPHEIARIGATLGADRFPMKLSDKPEDFARIYNDQNVLSESSSYRSCMSYDVSRYGTKYHPAYVYGAGDLQIAWIENPDSDSLEVLARSVIYPDRKRYVRIYSAPGRADIGTKLASQLEALGYEKREDLDGARLLRIPHGSNAVIMPYLDGSNGAEDCGDELIIGGNDIDADNTRGFSYIESSFVCDNCGDSYDESESREVVGHGMWCICCREESAFCCERSGGYYHADDSVSVNVRYGTEMWSQDSADDYAFYCDNTEEYYSQRHFNSVSVITDRRGNTENWCWCSTAEDYFICERDGNAYSADVFTEIEVNTKAGIKTWCKEESEDEFFECADCGEFFAEDMRADCGELFPVDICADCFADRRGDNSGLIPATPQGAIQDERQSELAI